MFLGSPVFTRNVTVTTSSPTVAMRNRESRWREEGCVCVSFVNAERWCRCRSVLKLQEKKKERKCKQECELLLQT